MSRVDVELAAPASAGYSIHIEPGLFGQLADRVKALAPAPSAVIISDNTVGDLYGDTARAALQAAGYDASMMTFPPGEGSKNLQWMQVLWDGMAKARVERASPVVALGGGVVGDMAGFVAATYLRGLPVVQVPTTLLAAVDSSVGGKTGVNHETAGKNMIGAFHQPVGVLIDPLLMRTLPPREWSCGLAESVKHGVIRDAAFFDWIEQHADTLAGIAQHAADRVESHAGTLVELLRRNCEIKAAVVAADERESGLRAILNFGHTIGHAIEALAGYGGLRHGECVSIGMAVETRIAVDCGLVEAALLDRLVSLLVRLNLPVSVPGDVTTQAVLDLAARDKKVKAGRVRYVLPRVMGETQIVDDVTPDQVAAALESCKLE